MPEQWTRSFGVRASGLPVPDLRFPTGDLYVFPETLEWTMVYTHEEEFGPYFTEREWCGMLAN